MLYEVCFVLYEPPVINGAHTPRMVVTEWLVEQELLTLPDHQSSPPVFSGFRVTRSLVSCVMFCRSLFVLLSFFFWPLCCLPFFDWWILINLPPWYLQTRLTTLRLWQQQMKSDLTTLRVWQQQMKSDLTTLRLWQQQMKSDLTTLRLWQQQMKSDQFLQMIYKKVILLLIFPCRKFDSCSGIKW